MTTQRPLQGRIAIVTGASRSIGIGAAICRQLAEKGADILFTHWQAYDAEMPWGAEEGYPTALKVELQGMGVRAEALSADLSYPAAPEQILDYCVATLGEPSILVNNATYSTQTPFAELTASELDAHYAVNMRGAFLLTTAFARRFERGAGGRILFLTSGQSQGPMPDELAYVATKGAVEAFTRSLAPAMGLKGITVNAVNPGPVDTGYMDEELRQRLLPRFPLGRLGRPEDAARLIAFLATDEAAWITGQVIHSEGGYLRS